MLLIDVCKCLLDYDCLGTHGGIPCLYHAALIGNQSLALVRVVHVVVVFVVADQHQAMLVPFPGEQLSGLRNDPLSAVVNLHHVDGCPYCNRNALVDVLCQQRRERCASDVFCSFPIGQNFIQCIGDNWRIAAETAGRTGIAYKFCAGIRAVLCAVFPVKAALVQVFVNKIGNAGAVACLPQQHDWALALSQPVGKPLWLR